jgi:hypothetical protein
VSSTPTSTPSRSPLVRLRKLLGHVRRAFVLDTYDVFAREAADADLDLRAPEGYRIRFGEPADLDACDPHHTQLTARECELGKRRLELGHRLVLITDAGGTPVFTMWVNPRNANVPGGIKRALGPDQVFIYKAFTSPDHRGRKLYQVGMRFVLADLRRRGLRELVGYAHTGKTVSRRGLASTGFRAVGRFRVIGFRRWTWTLSDRTLRRNFPTRVPRTGLELVG